MSESAKNEATQPEMEAMQKLYLELQMVEQYLKQHQERMEQVEAQHQELLSVVEAIEDLKEVKSGTRMLAPVTNGIFVEAKVESTAKLKVNVGENVTVEKTPDETIAVLREQEKEILQVKTTMEVEGAKAQERQEALHNELRTLIEDV